MKKDRLVEMLVFELNKKEYGISVVSSREVIKMLDIVSIPNAPEFIAGVINLRGNIICVMDLRKKFGFPVSLTDDQRIIVVRIANMIMGMIVDKVHEVTKVPKSQIDPVPKIVNIQIPHHSLVGIAKVESRIITLLNIENILSTEEIESLQTNI